MDENSINVETFSLNSFQPSILNIKKHIATLSPYNENHLAYVLFTSGSTGAPKGVQISFKNVKSFIDWTTKEYSLSELDIFLIRYHLLLISRY